MDEMVSIRILQLKNNFYSDNVSTERKVLGEFCVIGYFDAFDISKAEIVSESKVNIWDQLGKLTSELDGTMNCRMMVCITEQKEEDRAFWEDQSDILFFVTMVMVRAEMSADKMSDIMADLGNKKKRIAYWSYDHSEIIVITKTNRYSDGIQGVKELRNIFGTVKTYTVFAVMEKYLESYELIQNKLEDEKVFCRLHCMVKDYEEAEKFRVVLEQHISKRNKKEMEIRKFETFGEYDWLMELDDISICSIFECYKTKNLLTHMNEAYNRAFFNIESEIFVKEGEKSGGDVDRGPEAAVKE